MDKGSFDLMGYNAANLNQYEARKTKPAVSSHRLNLMCFSLFSIAFLVVILTVTSKVGSIKQFVQLNEL